MFCDKIWNPVKNLDYSHHNKVEVGKNPAENVEDLRNLLSFNLQRQAADNSQMNM